MNLNSEVKSIVGIERLIFKHNSKQLRANFVVYRCVANNIPATGVNDMVVKWHKKVPNNTMLKNLLVLK